MKITHITQVGLYVSNAKILRETTSHVSRENLVSEPASGYNPKRQISNELGLIGPYLKPAKFVDLRPF